MADYKELIRKAIQALPENNGAARRAVYEKARAALVGQLRGLNPPLAARDITQHRLQLEDCIRQVEQEASEAVIQGLKQNEELPPPPSHRALPPPGSRPAASARPTASSVRPATASPASRANGAAAPRPQPALPSARPVVASARPVTPAAGPRIAATAPRPAVASAPQASAPALRAPVAAKPAPRSLRAVTATRPQPEPEVESIEEIIAAAEQELEQEPEAFEPEVAPEPPAPRLEPRRRAAQPPRREEPARLEAPRLEPAPRAESRPLPAIVARAEAAKASSSRSNGRRVNGDDGARVPLAPPAPRLEPARRAASARANGASQPIAVPGRHGHAMSTVREVDLEEQHEGDPQVAIERAIATLEREARADEDELNGAEVEPERRPFGLGRRRAEARVETYDEDEEEEEEEHRRGFARAPVEPERGNSAVTIFLLVFLLLLVGVGGAGFWAWREGYLDFDAMFGKAPATADQASAPIAAAPAAAPVAPAPATNTEASTPAPAANPPPALAAAPAPAAAAPAEPSAQTATAPKIEDRLTQSADAAPATPTAPDSSGNTAAPVAAPTGSQSLLLEASQDGTQGAVPFSGTVDWSKGTDEMGQPTIVGKANIPARNLGVSILIRKNSDPTLPASHLMEINFSVNDSFVGGSVSGLPGVLLKNEELVQGQPLIGASARVVGNSFLFALSASPQDEATNQDLLTSSKWMDLAVIYATGKKAIITLEKDDKATALFNAVFAAWSKTASAPAAAAPAAAAKQQ